MALPHTPATGSADRQPAVARPPRWGWPAGGAALALAGCIVVPRTADVYDPHCGTYVRQVVLEAEVVGAIGHCHNDGCAAMLAAMGIISAASAVVSGSVAIAGNIAYWVERRGRCPDPGPQPTTLPAAPG